MACEMHLAASMNAPMELKPPVVLDACETDQATCHPPARTLDRYVSNEIGPRRKKVVSQHLDGCEDCRKSVARLHTIARTFRDWERSAIKEVERGGHATGRANY